MDKTVTLSFSIADASCDMDIPLLDTNWLLLFIVMNKLESLPCKTMKYKALLLDNSTGESQAITAQDIRKMASRRHFCHSENFQAVYDIAMEQLPCVSFGRLFHLECYHCKNICTGCLCHEMKTASTLLLEAVLTPGCWTPLGPHMFISNRRCERYMQAILHDSVLLTESGKLMVNTIQFLINTKTQDIWFCHRIGNCQVRPKLMTLTLPHVFIDILLSHDTLQRYNLLHMTVFSLLGVMDDNWLEQNSDMPRDLMQHVNYLYQLTTPFNWCVPTKTKTNISPLGTHTHCRMREEEGAEHHHHHHHNNSIGVEQSVLERQYNCFCWEIFYHVDTGLEQIQPMQSGH